MSVFLPGTFLMCCALTTHVLKCPSSRLNTGCQYTPVDSIATCVTLASASHWRSSTRSAVIVPNCRSVLCTVPSLASRMRHARHYHFLVHVQPTHTRIQRPQPRNATLLLAHRPSPFLAACPGDIRLIRFSF